MNNELFKLPNGEAIRPSCIAAIRKGDAVPNNEYAKHPRLIIEYGDLSKGGGLFQMVVDCHSVEHRDTVARDLQLHAKADAQREEAIRRENREAAARV